jgi:hypothetical protein
VGICCSRDNFSSTSPLKPMTTQPSESPMDTIIKNWAKSTRPGTARNATEDLRKKESLSHAVVHQEARKPYASSKPDYKSGPEKWVNHQLRCINGGHLLRHLRLLVLFSPGPGMMSTTLVGVFVCIRGMRHRNAEGNWEASPSRQRRRPISTKSLSPC